MNVLQVLEIMKTHVVTVRGDSTLADAIDRMDLYQVDELPVVDADGILMGMISEFIIARTLAELAGRTDNLGSVDFSEFASFLSLQLVPESMSHDVVSVRDIDEVTPELVLQILTEQRRVPVLDSENKIVGTLNRVDIIQALFERTIRLG